MIFNCFEPCIRVCTCIIRFIVAYIREKFRPASAADSMAKDLGALRSNGDVAIVCEGRRIKAHRFVLRARSRVFAAMLDSDMTEARSGEIKVDDASPDTMLRFVE